MPLQDILLNYEHGVSIAEISEHLRIPLRIIQELLNYAESRRTLARPTRSERALYGTQHFLHKHKVETVDDRGWAYIPDGDRITAAEAAGFDRR